MPGGEHRSADHGSEARVYQDLPAYDHEDPGALGVTSGGALDAIEIAVFHSGVWKFRTSSASRFRASAFRFRMSRSRASCRVRPTSRTAASRAFSMKSERFLCSPERRSISFRRSSESVIDVFTFMFAIILQKVDKRQGAC